ncbi:MAG TPA: DNA-processing protein DprA [Candidatus Brocadiia bacterium]|nr:DNA-processing protein DprA [Candidatus Brocadiia bacterium]
MVDYSTLHEADAIRDARILLACVPEIGPINHRRILAACRARGAPLHEILRPGGPFPRWLADSVSLPAAAGLGRLLQEIPILRRKLSLLSASGVHVILDTDDSYPSSLRDLGAGAPCALFYRGNVDLLGRALVAVIGACEPAPRAVFAARAISAQVAADKGVVISGNADGIDRSAHFAVLESGGASVFVPACGIACFVHHPEIRRIADAGNSLIISHAPPFSGWMTRWAFIRNSTVAALSRMVIAVQAEPRGGTMFTASKALRMGRAVRACLYSPPFGECGGNTILISRGAMPIRVCAAHGRLQMEFTHDIAAIRQSRLQPALFRPDDI